MEFNLTLNCDNDAFAEDPRAEIARILREAADKLDASVEFSGLRDINGNTVGRFCLDR